VVERVVGVVLGLDLGESPIGLIAVGFSNPAGVTVRIEEVDVDAASAVRLEGLEEPPRPGGPAELDPDLPSPRPDRRRPRPGTDDSQD
jgi:hypothetical protein